MRAMKKSRKGKHYGTTIVLFTDDDEELTSFTIWVGGTEPSDEELALHGLTRQDWNLNVRVDDGWGTGNKVPCQQADLIDWSHYQSEREASIADLIVDLVNGR